MRVLHVCSSDSVGGAARSAMNLHKALMHLDVDSVFLVAEKLDNTQPTVFSYKNGYLKRRILGWIDSIFNSLYKGRSKDFPFSNNWFPFTGFAKAVRRLKPDIVHLHWIGKGMIRMEDLRKLGLPVVWTMHDNFTFTGGCHLVNECVRFQNACRQCPQLGSSHNFDLSSYNFRRKKRLYRSVVINFIAPSLWMQSIAKSSSLLRTGKVTHMPNTISLDEYYPLNKKFAKESVGANPDRKLVMFGALHSTSDVNKGFTELVSALQMLNPSMDIELCVFGASKPSSDTSLPFRTTYLGYVNDLIAKRIMYSAADVVVVPSKVENLSNVIMEAMACGTPVAAFNTGGNRDLIDHKQSGYLAVKCDVKDLSNGIEWLLYDAEAEKTGVAARKKIADCFDTDRVAGQHISFYKSLLNEE